MSDVMTQVLAIIGAVAGVAGTIVAGLAYLHSVMLEKVHLRVGTGWATDAMATRAYISVTNLSAFPVTIREVGFISRDENKRFIMPGMFGTVLPARMEPRTSKSFYFDPTFQVSEANQEAHAAYAQTDCGERRFAKGPLPRPH